VTYCNVIFAAPIRFDSANGSKRPLRTRASEIANSDHNFTTVCLNSRNRLLIVVAHDLGKRMNRLPQRMEVPQSAIKATRTDGNQFEMSLFDLTPDDSMNSLEREVASFLEEQSPLYSLYRNVPQRGYYFRAGRSLDFSRILFSLLPVT
jgi:hypothetical protein